MEEDFDFIVEHAGKPFIEAEGDKDYVPVIQVFDHYEVRNRDAKDVSEILGIDESDVRNGIHYWRSSSEVYEELEDAVEDFSGVDHISGAAELVGEDFSRSYDGAYRDKKSEKEDGREKNSRLVNPLHGVENGFIELLEDTEIPVSEENIEDLPDDNYLGEEMVEAHLEWERNGSELGVYAGWSNETGMDTGFVSYSVDGEMGEVLQVEKGSMEDMVQEMYRNAVFGSL